MLTQALIIGLVSAAVFVGLALMSDRKRGALIAQGVVVLAAVVIFVTIVAGPVAGFVEREVVAFAVGLIAAAVAGMLYHLYLGRFERVWVARGIFTGVFLGLAFVFGLVFLSRT